MNPNDLGVAITPIRGESIVTQEGYPTLRFVNLIEILVRYVNSQQTEIRNLKARVAELEG